MHKNLPKIFAVLALLIVPQIFSLIGSQSPSVDPLEATRALCVSCSEIVPLAAKVCNLCVGDIALIPNLVVTDSITFCSGATGFPVACFDDVLTWGPSEMLPSISSGLGAPTAFTPYANLVTLQGWTLCDPTETACPPAFMTVQFEVPQDIDPSVTPVVGIHFFLSGADASWVRFLVQADFLGDGQDIPVLTLPPVLVESEDKQVFGPAISLLRQYQVFVPLLEAGPLLTGGNFGQITISRIPNTTDPGDEADDIYLSAISFTYRKLGCALIPPVTGATGVLPPIIPG